ncbi:LLM class flavin-dependent oxidoreductase [Streptomyces sp. NRRL WC-3742]|uniref:LLM class flavin-dependent oxidoreductase n=1 Tax=Streptomyces sp. NRRL WC-3742 TaxID=1463934 RepID=UPI0004C603F5|nr:LLM class flavin-dependent oxidoreductase [Streptomyces sp. NRRL WC-3742]
MTAFSVLDQGPRRAGTGTSELLAEAVQLALHVEELGFSRYWVAEHHAEAAVGISAPEIVIAHLAARTTRLRIGAGGMLLPNHSPLHVAEQFRTLEALHPGRIDLGIGRSSGTGHGPTAALLQRSSLAPEVFNGQLAQLLAFGGHAALPQGHELAGVRAVPTDAPLPGVFLLGGSPASAGVAARLGLGYAYLAAYQDPANAFAALRRYREQFRPAREGARPWAVLTLTVVVGRDDRHAEELATPWRLALAQHAAGNSAPLLSVEEALAHRPTPAERAVQRAAPLNDLRAEVVGGPDTVAAKLKSFTEESGADEVMVVANTYDPADRRESYTRLAELAGLGA